MDHHDDDPAEQLRRAQARNEADRADSSRYESLDSHDTQPIPVVRKRNRRRWAIGAAVAALLATGIAVPALAAGGSEPAAGGEPAQVQPADAGTPTDAPSDAPSDPPTDAPAPPSTAPSDAPSGAPAPCGPAAGPGKDAPRPPKPGKDAPKPPKPGKDAPTPPKPGKDAPKPPAPGSSDAPEPPAPRSDAPNPPAPPSAAPTTGPTAGS